nr:transposase [Streptomyces regalis]
MDAHEVNRVRAKLALYVADVFASVPRKDQRAKGDCYLRGLMLDGRRKSIQAIRRPVPVRPQGGGPTLHTPSLPTGGGPCAGPPQEGTWPRQPVGRTSSATDDRSPPRCSSHLQDRGHEEGVSEGQVIPGDDRRCAGTCSCPSTRGRNSSRSSGPRRTYLST